MRRQRASGRRRRAPSPVQGASTRTRSKLPGRPVGLPAVAHDGRPFPRAGPRSRVVPGRRGGAVARPPAGGAPLRGQRAQQRGLAARAGAQVQPARVRALERGVGQRQGDQLGPLVLHAGAPGRRRRAHRGRPVPDARPAVSTACAWPLAPRGRRPARRRSTSPGRATRVTAGARCRRPAGRRARRPAGRPSASARASTTQRGWECASAAKPWGSRPGRARAERPRSSRSCSPTRRSTALTKPVGLRPTCRAGPGRPRWPPRRAAAPAWTAAGGRPAAARRAPGRRSAPAGGRRRRRGPRRRCPDAAACRRRARWPARRRGRTGRARAALPASARLA